MNKDLTNAFNKLAAIISNDERCLGGWHFGSVSRGLQDEYSDVDPVFLIQEKYFEEYEREIPDMFKKVSDEVILIWPEDYNSNALKNFGILFKINNNILQSDFFIINSARINEPFCKIHYEGCTEKNIIFDRDNTVKKLLSVPHKGVVEKRDIPRLIIKYWFHVNMLVKYYFRKDIFKLLKNIEYLLYTHTEILLSQFQKTTWGGWESKIKYNIPEDKQENLLQYFCPGKLDDIRKTIIRCMELFSADAREICSQKGIKYLEEMEETIRSNFLQKVKQGSGT